MLVPCCVVYILVTYFCNHLAEEERNGCFAFIVFLLSCGCLCAVTLPRGAIDCSAVCDYLIRIHLLLTQYMHRSRKFYQRGSNYDDNHILVDEGREDPKVGRHRPTSETLAGR